MLRILTTALLTATAFFAIQTSALACKADKARLEIRLFRYVGVEANSASNVKDQFARFYGIVSEKLNAIRFHIRESGIDVQYLDDMKVKPERSRLDQIYNETPPQSASDLKNTWELYQKQLLLLRGDFGTSGAAGVPTITSWIYWGEPVPSGLPVIVHVEGPLDLDGADHARDAHSFVAMFALAVDAERHCSKDVYLRMYGVALDAARDLAKNKGPLSPHLAAMKAYLEAKVPDWVS